MVAHIAVPLALADSLCCLGLGFLLAVLYDAGRLVFGSAKPVCFVLDLAAFLLAAVLLCSFSASRSYSGVVRWYMAAGLLAGLAGYFFVLAPATQAMQRLLRWALSRPFVLLWLLAGRPAARLAGRAWGKAAAKRRNKAAKRRTKQLQKTAKVLYNSNV